MGMFDNLPDEGIESSSDSGLFGHLPEEKSNPLRRYLADPLISGVKGAIGVPEAAVGLADMVSGGRAGKFLEDEVGFKPKEAKNTLNELYSPEQRAANEYVQQGEGLFDTLGRAIEKPSTIGHAVVESLPLSVGGGLVGRGMVNVAKATPWVAGAVGEGLVGAGSAAEQIRQETEDGLTSPEQNALAAASGLGTGAFGAIGAKFAGSKLGQKLGIADIEASIAGGTVGQPVSKGVTGLAKRMAGGAVSEGLIEEGSQSAWEQSMQNLATGKPWYEGLGNATAMGILTGGVMGAGFNALPRKEPAAPPPNVNPLAEIAGLLPAPVSTGVSGADVVGIDTAHQASMDKAVANAQQIYDARDAYEAMKATFPFGMPTVTTPLQPIQEQINALVGINAGKTLTGIEKIQYQQAMKKLLDTPVGITNDSNGIEIPLTMGDLLDTQARAEEMLRAKAATGVAPIPVVGPLSAAANTAVSTGAVEAMQPQPEPAPVVYPTGKQSQGVNYGDGGTGEVSVDHKEDGSFTVTSNWNKGTAKKTVGGTFPAGTDVNVAVDGVTKNHGGHKAADQVAGAGKKVETPAEAPKADVSALFDEVMSEEAAAPAATTAKKPEITYEQYKSDMNQLLQAAGKYKPSEVGFGVYSEKMAELADKYPEFDKRLDEESNSVPANYAQNTPPPAPRSPAPESSQAPVVKSDIPTPASSIAPAPTEHNAEVYRPLIERLRNGKEFHFDLNGAIAKAKKAMNGEKQMPGSFRKLANEAEKKGDSDTAAVLRQIADLNDGRKAENRTPEPTPGQSEKEQPKGEDHGQGQKTPEKVLTPLAPSPEKEAPATDGSAPEITPQDQYAAIIDGDQPAPPVKKSLTTEQAPKSLPAVRQELSVEFGGTRYPVESFEDASKKWEKFRDETGEGASVLGSDLPIFDQSGKKVAYISYNGRVWPGSEYDKNAKPIYLPERETETLPERIAAAKEAASADADAALEAARKLLLVYTAGRADIYALSGNAKASVRAHVMAALMGVDKVPQAKAGVTALREEFYRRARIDGNVSSASSEDAFIKWAKGEENPKTLPERVAEARKKKEEDKTERANKLAALMEKRKAKTASPENEAERAKDDKGNPIYKKGERVEFVTGRNAGRHGEVSEVNSYRMQSVMMFSRESSISNPIYSYKVKTDNGSEFHANPDEISFETGRPESVIPDPVVDGYPVEPESLYRSIGYTKQSESNLRAKAQRARKSDVIASHKRQADAEAKKAAKAQAEWDDWAKAYPSEAEKIAPKKIIPASTAARKEAEGGTSDDPLKAAGLVVTKSKTNNGKDVWNVSGNTKEHSASIKSAGGRWYGPKKVWSFYNDDPSEAISNKLGGSVAPAPVLDANDVQLPGNPYVYRKEDGGWTWRHSASVGKGNPLGANGPLIPKLEAAYAAKNPTLNDTPTIEMSDIDLEKVLIDEDTTPVEKDRADAELTARDEADQPDIGAMFDDVMAEESAPNPDGDGQHDELDAEMRGYEAEPQQTDAFKENLAGIANALPKKMGRDFKFPEQPRTAGQAAASAASNVAKGTGDVFDALGALFGAKGSRLSMGLTFDEDTYKQAKPLFISALAHFKDAAADLKEAIRAVIKTMNSRFSPEVTANMKPYIVRFMEDVRDKKVVYDEDRKEYVDATQATSAAGNGTLPGVYPEGVSPNEEGGDSGIIRPEQSGSGAGTDGNASGGGIPANGGVGSGKGGASTRGRKPKRGSASNSGNVPDSPADQPYPIPSGLTDYIITSETRLGEGGAKTKFKNNLAAIRLINELDETSRPVTREDQDTLARYVGWGMLAQAFDPANKDWASEYAELKGLLSQEEYDAAYESTQYAHYTSEEIISNGIYAALERFGFSVGRILEPGSGVGNFVGLMPTSLRTAGSRFTGVERERISSKIGMYLYPTQNMLQADFTEFQSPDGYFDAVVGNPPFSATTLTDASGRKHLSGLSIHNYFLAKSVDQLRPGGVLAMVVSNSFLDAGKDRARQYIGDRTRFLGAIRLPNNAFKKNAGTEVTTDLIFLQKLDEADVASKATKKEAMAWMGTSLIPDPLGGDEIPLNDYFIAHPEMMIGRMERSGSMYRSGSVALAAKEGSNFSEQLKKAVALLPENVYIASALSEKALNSAVVALEDNTVQPGGMYTKDGDLYVRLQDEAGEKLAEKLTAESKWTEKTTIGESRLERLKALANLRRTVRQLLAAEIKDDSKAMKELRAQLNTQYDAIVKKWDFLSSKGTIQLIGDDPDYPLLAALEKDYNKGIDAANAKKHGISAVKPSAVKMPIFTQRVIPKHEEVSKAETPVDALMISIYERGHIDQEYISNLLGGINGKDVIDGLVKDGNLFFDPETNIHVLKDEYLSGNVRKKLNIAKAAGLHENVLALEGVIPEDIPSHDIIGKMGASWISNDVYQDFINELLGEGTTSRIKYSPAAGSFVVEIEAGSNFIDTNTLGIPITGGRATDLIEKILNKKQAKIGTYDSDGKFHLDKENTDKATDKMTEIKTRFGDWLFKDADRSEILTRVFNDTVNNYVKRIFDGSMLRFPGKVPDEIIKFRRHQRNAIARILQSGQALLDHVVGAGKTFTIVAAAMEMRRTGLAHKPMVTVPNHLVKQWASDFYRLYPGAKVLAATKNDFKRENRRAFMAKIATGDWDAVIIAHSTFGFIQPAKEFEIEFNGAQIKEITDAINELGGEVEKKDSRDSGTKRTVKQLAKMREKLKERIKALRQKPMDNLLDLAELGVDALFVDEAHKFKNLMFTTKMQGVRVGGDPAGSQRAYDMYIKTQQIMKKSGGRGVVFATGTPISNTMAEMYHVLRYLAPDTLVDMGLKTFDAWADAFASAETFWMQSMSGPGYKASTRLENFVNVPSLLKIYDQVADTVTMEDIKDAYREENPGKEFPIPPVKGGSARTAVSIKRSQAQSDYMKEIAERALELEKRKGPPQKGEDNMLSIMGDARKAAMDIRLVDKSVTERDPNGRIAVCAENVWQRYQQYNHVKGTQLIFSDMGTPKKSAAKELEEYKSLKERADRLDDNDLQDRATLGDEEAITELEDAEEAEAEIEKKGKDWVDAIQAALRGFSIYDDMKEALMEKGIPEHEIAFIHSYNTDDQKAALFKAVNSGTIRVLLGSTEKMGAGTNVQERAVALHHLDVPWRPSDVEQREGRVVRQGNKLLPVKGETPTADWVDGFEVEIMAYATQDTLDLYMWQTQENKLKMIGQLRTGVVDIEMDNAFEAMEFSAGEMQAAATSNPYLLDEIRVKDRIKKLERQKRSYEGQINDALNRKKNAERDIANLPDEIKKNADIRSGYEGYHNKLLKDNDALKMTVQGAEFTGVENIRNALNDATSALRDPIPVKIGDKEYQVKNDEDLSAAIRVGGKGLDSPAITISGKEYLFNLWGQLTKAGQTAFESALNATVQEKIKAEGFELGGKTYKSYSALAEGFRVLTGDREPIKFSTGGQNIIQRSKLKGAVSDVVAKAVDNESREFIGQFGETKVYVEAIPDRKDPEKIILNAQVENNGSSMNGDVLPPEVWQPEVEPALAKLMGERVVDKALRIMANAGAWEKDAIQRLEKAKRTLADIDKNKTNAEWPGEAELTTARAKYDEILKKLAGRANNEDPRNPPDFRKERMAPIDGMLGNQANDGRITPADKAVYGMVSEGKSAEDILKFIAGASRNPFYRQLAKLLLKTGIAPKMAATSSAGWKMNAGDGKYAAAYNPKTDTVALFRPASSERNALHEFMHAATLAAMAKNGLAAMQMRKLFEHVKKSGKLKGMYGMENVDEFIAEAFSNPKFQQALKKVSAPVGSTGLKSAWHWFVRVVRGILGLKQGEENALSMALELGVGVMRENMGAWAYGSSWAVGNLSANLNSTDAAEPAKPIGKATEIEVDGVMRSTLNSNGKPIHPTEEGVRNFWRWFGDSKVTDAQGRPMVVYHGSIHSGLEEIRPGSKEPGAWFTLDIGYANDYAKGPDGEIYEVYLAINNPFVVRFNDATKPFVDGSLLVDSEGEMIDNNVEIVKYAMKKRFDGLHTPDGNFSEADDAWVAFNTSQIKSATGNNGQFDPSNPDIRYNAASEWYSDNAPPALKTVLANALDTRTDTPWYAAFNTQNHKAKKWAAEGKVRFKSVFDLAQSFIGDTSKYAVLAQNEAPTLFHEIRSLEDAKTTLKTVKSLGDLTGKTHDKDIDAVASPLYEGTLKGGGNPMEGAVFSDTQLRNDYKLSDRQIKLYKEALAAVNVSIDEMAKSIIAKHAKANEVSFDKDMNVEDMAQEIVDQLEDKKQAAMESVGPDAEEAVSAQIADLAELDEPEQAKKLKKEFASMKKTAEAAVERLDKTINDINGLVSKNALLQKHGYFPLMRFGENTVTAKDEEGETKFFGMYEGIPLIPRSGKYQANKVADQIRKEHPDWTVTTGTMNTEKYKLYSGLNLEAVQLFAEHMDAESIEPFQEFLRLGFNNRSVMKRLMHREGTPGFDRDVRRTLAQFIVSNARHTSSNYNLYDMRKAAEEADKDGGEIGREAVKLFNYVSNPEEEAQALRGFLFFNFLGGSLASAMVNMTQVPLMTFPFLNQYEKATDLARTLAKSAKLAVMNPQNVQGTLGDALRRAEVDGVTAPQEIHQLTATAMNRAFSSNRAAGLFMRAWGAPFALAEAFNRRTTFIASYQIAEKMSKADLKKAGFDNAFDFAEDAVTRTQGTYNKGSRPNVGRGAVGATLMTFRQFSIMYLELLSSLPPKQKALMIGLLLLAAGGGGLPFAEDVEDIIDTIGQWMGYATNSKKAIRNSLSSLIGDRAADIAINGVASQMGADLHSRFGMHNLVPGTGVGKQSSVDKGRDIQEFFGPAGSVVKSIGDLVNNMATGKAKQAMMAVAPNAARNAALGAGMMATGQAEDAQGRKTIPVSGAEAALKVVGFNPKSVADFGALKRDISQDVRLVAVKREEFTSDMVQARLSGDTEAFKQAMVDMMRWNRDNVPAMRVIVDQNAVNRRVQQAKMEGSQRFLKTVPKGMRPSAREEFAR